MKRNPKPFSVEIKKSRVQGQHSHLAPRRLFAILPDEPAKVFQKEAPQVVAEPAVVPRILPSILAPGPDISKPVEPVHRKRSSPEAHRGQMEFDLVAIVPEDINDAHAQALEAADAVTPTDVTPGAGEGIALADDVRSAQAEPVKANVRQSRKKGSASVEQITALNPASGLELIGQADLIGHSYMVTSEKADQPRRTKRQAAAVQLPRHERWKRRLHPASW
ncbi:hypothetical protein [Microvirga sp. VF16]|uniref:hypothetical protein n=1 Tax=Microvirga sp. VF16 TaxID=2807101 RepID=UPI00193DB9EA|nr:hypothetical protein [Microvirga sp. VF16]QRM33511.1 hypothetical protein JO965_36350 [Microvirga sp. VF16]